MPNRTASISICSLCLGIAVFLLFYAPPLVFLLQAKRELHNSPGIWTVPKPLTPTPLASPNPKNQVVSYFGYQFESPTPEEKEERKDENVVALNFSNCAVMAILKPQPSGPLTSLIRQMPPNATRSFEVVYGKEAVSSDYEFRRTILNVTPKDLSLFARPGQMARNSTLLTLKGVESQRFKNGLYSFETPTMRGFQEGNITLDEGVAIQAFDHQDHLLTLIVGAKPGKACFGQPELNQIIFSLRPVTASE